jgi:hypothetical protein
MIPIPARFRRHSRDEHGAVVTAIIMFVPTVVLVTGLILDGGRLYAAEQDCGAVAASAARDAAQVVNEGALTNGSVLYTNADGYATSPEQAAREYLFLEGYTDPAQITVTYPMTAEGSSVRVEVHDEVQMLILGIIPGFTARPIVGVAQVRLRNEKSPS